MLDSGWLSSLALWSAANRGHPRFPGCQKGRVASEDYSESPPAIIRRELSRLGPINDCRDLRSVPGSRRWKTAMKSSLRWTECLASRCVKPAASISRKYTSLGAACTFLRHKRTTVVTQIEVDDAKLPPGAKPGESRPIPSLDARNGGKWHRRTPRRWSPRPGSSWSDCSGPSSQLCRGRAFWTPPRGTSEMLARSPPRRRCPLSRLSLRIAM